jgi:hypothetical protein
MVAPREIEGGEMRRTTLIAFLSFGLGGLMLGGIAIGKAGSSGPSAALPSALGVAKHGPLRAHDVILLGAKDVTLLGGWENPAVPCAESRLIDVDVLVQRTAPSGGGRFVRRNKSGVTMNCAEGGPNFGFTLSATGLRMACPDGSWARGRYDFVIHTLVRSGTLRATASMTWPNPTTC